MTTVVRKYQYWIRAAGRLFGCRSIHVPGDLIAVFLWSMIGLAMTALVAACEPGADLAGILAAAE